ncbi:hypothetical protein GHK92_17345 [Nocardioides sp. dk4132]|uniref:hypothetical protein n=1 Tax=unclassified Nocardioides TaxID=2615069 RepID=UPI001296796C|nr:MULTISPECIES: hypothetical protein [unclassified Nocardioides]MQW77640.1 hypothetical protein [Nocardioides sp. dk4132]QGA06165.1 hypothetical protein GFH29_01205 [Nocardioides sp. dk884]
MRDRQRRRNRPDRFYEPTLTLTTSAPPEVAVAALVDALIAARYRLQEREPTRARLRVGSWPRTLLVPDDIGFLQRLDLLPRRLVTWSFMATVDLETLDTAPQTQVRVRIHRVWGDERYGVPHTLRAVDAAMRALYAAGYQVEGSEVGEGPWLRP